MIQKNISFLQIVRRAMMVAALCGVCGVAHAASDGCDDENNNRITAELALCSVHAYNIGEVANTTASDRQLMKDVIALKTTVITQQMDKQYEYMEAMIRRLKTQLEKAVLTTKLQAAGASGTTNSSGDGTYSSGGSYGSTGGASGARNRNAIAGIEDCANTSSTSLDAMQCLLRNIPRIQSAVSAGDISAARRQLDTDLDVLNSYNRFDTNDSCYELKTKDRCKAISKNSGTRTEITNCLGSYRACIIKNSEELQKKSSPQYRPY